MAPDALGPEQVVFLFTDWNHTDSFDNDASLGPRSEYMFPWDLNIGLEAHGRSEPGKVVALVVSPFPLGRNGFVANHSFGVRDRERLAQQ